MALTPGGIPNLHQGVSQQPDPLRDATQGKLQINGVSSYTDGLRKREGTEVLARLSTTATPFESVLFHHIQRDGNNQYLVVFSRTQVRVFTLEGVELPVTMASSAAAYLTQATDASYDLRAATVADFTFLTNLRVSPAMLSLVTPPGRYRPPHEALIWVKAANYGQVYELYINGVGAKVETAATPTSVVNGSVVANSISGEQIAESLRVTLVGGTAQTIELLAGKPYITGIGARVDNSTTGVKSVATISNQNGVGVSATLTLTSGYVTSAVWTYAAGRGTNGYEVGDKIFARKGDLTGKPDNSLVHIGTVNSVTGPYTTRDGWTNGVKGYVGPGRYITLNIFRNPTTGYVSQYQIVPVAGQKAIVGERIYVALPDLIPNTNPANFVYLGKVRTVTGRLLNNVDIWRAGTVLWALSPDPMTVAAKDAKANEDIVAITDTVQTFGELPRIANHGYQVEVIGDKANRNDSYYVTFVLGSGSRGLGEGYWEECAAPGVVYRPNPQTMPHMLVRNPSGDGFWFGPALAPGTAQPADGMAIPSWGDRTCGDYVSNPDPPFLGQPINDIFVYKNRLCFLTGESVCMSRANRFFDFFRETVTTVLDSDPIAIQSSQEQISVLTYAQPQQDEVILFSQQLQFRLFSDDAGLSAASARASVLTNYEFDVGCRPVAMGGSLVIAVPNGDWTQIREFRTYGSGGNSLSAEAPEITEHVRNYIPSQVRQMVVNEAGNILVARSTRPCFRDRLYVYKYYNAGDGKRVQSSWSYWEFCVDEIKAILASDQKLYMVTQHGQEIWLERLSLADRPERVYGGEDSRGDTLLLPHEIYLDRRVSTTLRTPPGARVLEGVYDPVTDTTTWTLPYEIRCPSFPTQAWTAFGGTNAPPTPPVIQVFGTNPVAVVNVHAGASVTEPVTEPVTET